MRRGVKMGRSSRENAMVKDVWSRGAVGLTLRLFPATPTSTTTLQSVANFRFFSASTLHITRYNIPALELTYTCHPVRR